MFSGATSFNQYINDWSVNNVTTMEGMFAGATSFDQSLNKWVLSEKLIDASGMFMGASSFNQEISNWFPRGSKVTNMPNMFQDASNFNQIVYTWDVSNVTNMERMFKDANTFGSNKSVVIEPWGNLSDVSITDISSGIDISLGTGEGWWRGFRSTDNIDFSSGVNYYFDNTNVLPSGEDFTGKVPNAVERIDLWKLHNVTNMKDTFNNKSFENKDASNITGWDVSNVTTMEGMFQDCSGFNQDISNWNVSNVTTMKSMFAGATSFNQYINDWDVSNVTTMEGMFQDCSGFNQDISNWNVSNVTTMKSMFAGATSFNQYINDWDVSNVVSMESMFENASTFNKELENWKLVELNTTKKMFKNASNFNKPLSDWSYNINLIINTESMFEKATSFNQNLSSWKFELVTDICGMFKDASSFNNHPMEIDSVNLKSANSLFEGASSFNKPLNFKLEKSNNLTELKFIFKNATQFNSSLSFEKFYNVRKLTGMFENATSFNYDISNWKVNKITHTDIMFKNATNFNKDISVWPLEAIRDASNMFQNAQAFINSSYAENITDPTNRYTWGNMGIDSIPVNYLDTSINLNLDVEPWWNGIDLNNSNSIKTSTTASITEDFVSIINRLTNEFSNNLINKKIIATSEGTGFLPSPRYGFLSINDYQNDYHDKIKIVYNNNIESNNIISKINLTPYTSKSLASRDSAMLRLRNKTRNYIKPVNINKLNIKFYDEYGRIIDLNNMDWSFTLVVEKELSNIMETL